MERQISKTTSAEQIERFEKIKNKLIKDNTHFGNRLFNAIRAKGNFLCLGIDPHLDLILNFPKKNKITDEIYTKENIKIVDLFCKSLIETTTDLIPVFKIQISFLNNLVPKV